MITQGAKIVTHIHQEMALHIDYCKGFGVTKEEIVATEEHQGKSEENTRTTANIEYQLVLHIPGIYHTLRVTEDILTKPDMYSTSVSLKTGLPCKLHYRPAYWDMGKLPEGFMQTLKQSARGMCIGNGLKTMLQMTTQKP
jgi:hypothetical protein